MNGRKAGSLESARESDPSGLTPAQARLKRKLQWTVFGVGFGLAAVVGLGFPILFGVTNAVAAGIGALAALLISAVTAVTYLVRASKLTCPECRSRFAIALIDRDEQLIAAVPRQQVTVVATSNSTGGQKNEYSSWVDEKYNVTDTYQCVVCGREYAERHIETRRTGVETSREF